MTSVSCTDVKLNSQNALLVDGKYRYLVKPGTDDISGSFSMASESKTFTCTGSSGISAGSYKTYKVSAKITAKGEETHTLAVGDFYMNDGRVLSTLPDEEKGNCIGIVFSTTSPYSQDKTLNPKFKHGLVMALTDASTSAQWKTSNDGDEEKLTNCETLQECRDDLSGYSNSNKIWTTYNSSLSNYPAFQKAKEYTTTLPEGKTSGWFLPSIGQWIDILANLGGKSFKEGTSESITNTSGDIYITNNAASSAANSIDAYLNKVGSSYVDLIGWSGSSSQLFWTSSEYSSSLARDVDFSNGGYLYLYYNGKDGSYRVRCVLAF